MKTIELNDKTAAAIENTCERYGLDMSDLMNDLVDDYLDELIDKYGIKPIEEQAEGIEPGWTEEYLNSLGMSKGDFL